MKKFRSFSRRLTRRLVLTLLIIMGIASFLVFILCGSFIFGDEEMRHEAMLKASAENVSRVLSDVYVGTINHVPEIEENLDRPDHLMKVTKRIIEQNPRIRSCGISFVENYYPQKGRCYMPYAVRRDSNTIEVLNQGAKQQDYLQQDWFQQGLETEKGFWSEPFFEGNDTIFPLVAYIHPIRDKQGRTVAVLGSDLSLEWLQAKVGKKDMAIFANQWGSMDEDKRERKKNSRWQPYSFIISEKGTFVVHPDKKRIVRDNYSSIVKAASDTAMANIFGQMMMEDRKVEADSLPIEFVVDGRDSYLFYTPIKHAGWSMVLVVSKLAFELPSYVVAGLLVFLLLTAMFVVWLVSRTFIKRATKPLKQLASSAEEVANGNFSASLPEIKRNDEIRQLRDSFEDMQQSLKTYIEELKITTASKAAIENELKVAHDIQMSMLPKIFPPYPERDDIDIYGLLNPAKDVGGDLFDFYIRDNQLYFCIGDVSGKGVPASLVMAVTRSLFRNVSSHSSEPGQIATALNKALSEGNETNMFVTFFVGVLNLADGNLLYCNAGHEAPLLVGKGIGTLPCDANLPLGIMPDWSFTQQQVTIYPQTVIFLFTDGLSEAEDADHTQFGEERILAVAEKVLSQQQLQSQIFIDEMADAVNRFVGDAEQSDDLTMLALQYKPNMK